MSSRIASNTILNCESYFCSSASSLAASSVFDWSSCRSRTNARMISMLTCTARGLRRTLESMATPCSVKAWGRCRRPPLEITVCDLKSDTPMIAAASASGTVVRTLRDRTSASVSLNMKSAGNRSAFRLTA